MSNDPTETHTRNTGSKRGRPENLKPWQPGQSGNPAGRPKGVKFLSEALREALSASAPDGISWTEKVAQALIDRACLGDPAAFREIADRIEGKVKESVEVSGQTTSIHKERLAVLLASVREAGLLDQIEAEELAAEQRSLPPASEEKP
jgi:hypothetical protein